jgi:hypothetical protein
MYHRLEERVQTKMWSHFPRFLSCCCIGSAIGFAGWAARTQSVALEFAALAPYHPFDSTSSSLKTFPDPSPPPCDLSFYSDFNSTGNPPLQVINSRITLKSNGEMWNAIFFVMYPIEFLFLTLAKGAAATPSRPALPCNL